MPVLWSSTDQCLRCCLKVFSQLQNLSKSNNTYSRLRQHLTRFKSLLEHLRAVFVKQCYNLLQWYEYTALHICWGRSWTVSRVEPVTGLCSKAKATHTGTIPNPFSTSSHGCAFAIVMKRWVMARRPVRQTSQ